MPDPNLRLQITGPDNTQTDVVLTPSSTIGRQPGNDIVINDQRVSRQHAVITCQAGVCHITDLGSSNGTYLDGERLAPNVPTLLTPGVAVTVGSYSLVLHVEPVPEPEPAEPAQPGTAGPPQKPADDESGQAPATTSLEADRGQPPGTPPPAPIPPRTGATRGIDTELHGRRLLDYLPGIYHSEHMEQFLGIFEATLNPIEWTIDNFDLFLNPATAPGAFLRWLAEWFDITFDPSWSDAQRRQLLREAHAIYARRGTRWSLRRVLEIYTGQVPRIDDTDASLEPHTFRVALPASVVRIDRKLIESLIDAHKPAHTTYTLEFTDL